MENNQQSTPVVAKPALPNSSDNKTISLIIGALVILIVFAIIGVAVGTTLIINTSRPTPTPIPTVAPPTPTPTPRPPSKFSSDPQVLKLRDDLRKLQSDIDTMDYFEAQMTPPSLDIKINIE